MASKKRKAKPLDERTLRYVIRVLRKTANNDDKLAEVSWATEVKKVCEYHAFAERWMADVFAAKLRELKRGKR